MKKLLAVSTLFVLAMLSQAIYAGDPVKGVLAQSGTDGYSTYRIPALVTLPPNAEYPNGVVIAFYEARKDGKSDHGAIDLVMKKSIDNAQTWSAQQVVWSDSGNTCGNPCPVYDSRTGKIILLMTWNSGEDTEKSILDKTSKDTRRVFVCESADYGKTWSKPSDISKYVKDMDNWTWYATGPGNGIQIKNGKYAGRLVIPCNHNLFTDKKYYSHVIYSDDGGLTWAKGNSMDLADTNEDTVVEMTADSEHSNGDIMLNMRNQDKTNPYRKVSFSSDGGITWQGSYLEKNLVCPCCEANMVRYSWPDSATGSIILFSNPADKSKRKNMTIRLSYDNGKTWPVSKLLDSGSTAYSCLTKLNNGEILCIYEFNNYAYINTARFSLDWLKN